MKLFRNWPFAVIFSACAVGPLIITAAPAPAHAAPADVPPQCFTVRIVQAAPAATLWVKFCGTGPAGTSPLEEGVSGHGPLIVDGGDLTPGNCPRTAPCPVLWPASPQS